MRPIVFGVLLILAGPALAAPAPKPGPTGDAADLADKLMEKIDFERIQNTGVRAVLDVFQEKTGVTVLLDYQPLGGAVGVEGDALNEHPINVRAGKGVRAETVLKQIAGQLNAVIYYHPDHVLVTTPETMAELVGISRGRRCWCSGVLRKTRWASSRRSSGPRVT